MIFFKNHNKVFSFTCLNKIITFEIQTHYFPLALVEGRKRGRSEISQIKYCLFVFPLGFTPIFLFTFLFCTFFFSVYLQ